jgi:hypothetical protein
LASTNSNDRGAAKHRTAQQAGACAAVEDDAAATSYTPSEKAQATEHAAAHGVSAASDKFDSSRFPIQDWQRKLEKAAASAAERTETFCNGGTSSARSSLP